MPQLQHERCTVPGCTRPHKARGYCQAHYQHFKRGVPIGREIVTRDTTPYEHCMEPECESPVKSKGLCKMHYARLLRHGHTRYPDRKKQAKLCTAEGCQDHLYAKGLCHQHYIRMRRLRDRYGMTPADEAAMLAQQNGSCAICKNSVTRMDHRSGKQNPLAIDHDHATGAVRGLLCDTCNRAIGLLGDSAETLRSAIAYLERHRSSTAPEQQAPAADGSARDYLDLAAGPRVWPPAAGTA